MDPTTLLRRLPAVGRLLGEPLLEGVMELYGRDAVRVQAQQEIAALRRRISATGGALDIERELDALPRTVASGVEGRFQGLRPVLNATGILIHTNLGRSPLPSDVLEEITPLLTDYCDLEIDLDTGLRGERNRKIGALLTHLTGADAALVTNNNAAALILALSTLAAGKRVLVSRGELVEIGGSFRIPDILEASGAVLQEVGTTNRTHLRDYEKSVDEDTAMILKVHTSNYRIRGFTHSVETAELAPLARRHGIPLLVDEGSGLLRPSNRPQLREHAALSDLIEDGADLVCGSGDKLLGGPQAGLLLGRRDLVDACLRFPLYRALRPNRFTYAALDAVLRRRLAGRPMPLDRLWPDPATHQTRLERICRALPGADIVAVEAFIGGGSAPDEAIPGHAVALKHMDEAAVRRLRLGDAQAGLPGVAGYQRDGRLILDFRTIEPSDDETVLAAVRHAQGTS